MNEHKYRWVFETDWVFETAFNADNELLNKKNLLITFLGIDTLSDLYLNDIKILSTDNMHKTYEIDIKNNVAPGENILRVDIFSPVKYTSELIKKTGDSLSSGGCSIPGGPFIRKAQYSYGWD